MLFFCTSCVILAYFSTYGEGNQAEDLVENYDSMKKYRWVNLSFWFGWLEYLDKRRFSIRQKTRICMIFPGFISISWFLSAKRGFREAIRTKWESSPQYSPQEWGRFLGRALREPKNSVGGWSYIYEYKVSMYLKGKLYGIYEIMDLG